MNHLVGVDDGHQVDFRWLKTRGLGSFIFSKFLRIGDFLCFVGTNFCD